MAETPISVSPELRRLLIHCEENCTADCCKSRAFTIDARTVGSWVDGEHIDRSSNIQAELAELISAIDGLETIIVLEARGLGSVWDRNEIQSLLKKLAACHAAAIK